MSKLRLPLYIACAVSPFMVASASLPSVADETFTLKNIISLPDGQTLRAFDISFVDPFSHRYALAVSATAAFPAVGTASNPAIVVVDTQFNVVINEFNPTPSFAGNCQASAAAPRNTYGGPNGVMIVERGRNADIWAGDGPKFNTPCDPTSTVTAYSSVKVLDLYTGALRKSIPLGGIRRSDELCYNPVSDVVLIANDDPLDNFISFIGEDRYNVIQQMKFDGSDPYAKNLVANGIEQCDFNPRDGKFYINLPNVVTKTNPAAPGVVLRISGEAPFHVEQVFSLDPTCGGASGLKIGPDHQIGLACGGVNAEIIDSRTGGKIALLPGLGGADETWYDPRSRHYFFGISTPGTLGVADAGPPPSVDPSTPTASGSHSVAADPITNHVYVPIRGGAGTVCSSGHDVFGVKGNDTLGCIAVYASKPQFAP
jgi:hypothetical protein